MKGIEAGARTMVTWGKPRKEVISFLVSERMQHERALKLVEKLFEERYAAIRARGYRRILIGGVVCLVASILVITMFRGGDLAVHFTGRTPGAAIAIVLMGFVWGLWTLMDGIRDAFQSVKIADNLGTNQEDIM